MSARLLSWLLLPAACGAASGGYMEVPFFRQEKNGCGAASAAMVMQYWVDQVRRLPWLTYSPRQVYRDLYDTRRNTVQLADMKQYLEQEGYRAFTLRGSWADLEEQLGKGRPVIVGLRHAPDEALHFTVAVGAAPDLLWVNDPARKEVHSVARDEFETQWERAGRWMLLAAPGR